MESESVARYCGVHILDNPFSIDGVFHYFVPPTWRTGWYGGRS